MIRIQEVKLRLGHTSQDLIKAISTVLGIGQKEILNFQVLRQSVDARKKKSLHYVYIIDVETVAEEKVVRRLNSPRVTRIEKETYGFPVVSGSLPSRPVIIGAGPAGLFAGLFLSRAGLCPIILERGKTVAERIKDVKRFFEEGILDCESNIQFGEGGAGTFSDGKLTTLINDPRCDTVLSELVAAGAPKEILYQNKPHVGTDNLRKVVTTLREKIVSLGGEIRFQNKVTEFMVDKQQILAVRVNGGETISTSTLICAPGNGARDTFLALHETGVQLLPKALSIGVRIEHPADLINRAQYGPFANHPHLGAADYKMVHHSRNGYSAYTFCMCPGGMVVAAASENGGVVTNGMSEFARNRPNSNSALMVGVGPKEYGSSNPLAGIEFQRFWEKKAYISGGCNFWAPAQRVEDFIQDRYSKHWGEVKPSYLPGVVPGDLRDCLPAYVCAALKEGILAFNKKLNGFSLADAVLTGVETRSSSPVRIVRDGLYQTNITGLYSAGEGAGYAGGIMSAAVDGIKVAEAVVKGIKKL